MSPSSDGAAASLLVIFGTILLTVAIAPYFTTKEIERNQVVGTISGALFIICGVLWNGMAENFLGQAVAARFAGFASNVWTWAALSLFLLAYVMVSSMVSGKERQRLVNIIETDILPFQAALMKWVLPRRLSYDQQTVITEHLSQFPSQQIELRANSNDEEANEYRGDFHRAFQRGGWKVESVNDETIRPGLHIHFYWGAETQKKYRETMKPKLNAIVTEAFRKASVPVLSTGSGTGQGGSEEERLCVDIGPRPRGRRGEIQAWKDALTVQ